jgi:hypothetical protein
MKTMYFRPLLACLLAMGLFSACSTTQCACGNNQKYKKRKARVSLIDSQKSSTFAFQIEAKVIHIS